MLAARKPIQEPHMDYVVRAVDVGFGNTKYVSNVAGSDIRCASFPSVAYPTMREPSGQPGYERRKTVAIPINGQIAQVDAIFQLLWKVGYPKLLDIKFVFEFVA